MTHSPFDDMPPIDVNQPPMIRPPIAMILFCPACGDQHVDKPSETWANPPHRSHRCEYCGYIWRPADVETMGVAEIRTKGKDDSQPPIRRVRNTGKTTQQMRDAPEGAVFVWCVERTEYAAALARHLGRADLRIVGPRELIRVRPPLSGIVVDHAANPSGLQWAIIRTLKTYVR